MSQTTPELTDAALIAGILVGSDRAEVESAYRILTERYWKVVLVLFRSRVSSERDAEDLSQEAFLRAFRSLGQLQEPKLFLGWMLRICRNLATDHLRKRKPEASLEGLGERGVDAQSQNDDSAQKVQATLEREEEMTRVMKAVDRLSEKYRTVVVLRYLKGLSNRELAERLGEPEGTIRNRVFRALGKLRGVLQPSTDPRAEITGREGISGRERISARAEVQHAGDRNTGGNR
jgi:RNA polymerase sigma-70 factor (ECF subfamily)